MENLPSSSMDGMKVRKKILCLMVCLIIFFQGTSTPWNPTVVQKLCEYRGGCVFAVDYYYYAKAKVTADYVTLVGHFSGISAVVLKKVKQVNKPEQTYM